MPKYRYIRLKVMCSVPRYYGLDQMREAVEYLRTQPSIPTIGLAAETNVVRKNFWLFAQPMIPLKEIEGKTPSQVWDLLDIAVDRQAGFLEKRFEPGYGRI